MLRLFAFRRPLGLFCLAAAAAVQPASAAPAPQPVDAYRQNYEPRPAIWLLSDADTKIYLFGTIHMLAPGFKWESPAVKRMVGEADELVVEHYVAPEAELKERAAAVRLLLLAEPDPILERVPADKRPALAAAIEQSKLPVAAYDRLQTWAAAFMLGLERLIAGYGAKDLDEAPGVEDVFEASFRAARKPISSVEDSTKVIAEISALPADVQRELLLDALEGIDEPPERSAGDDHQWAQGRFDPAKVDELFAGLPPAFNDILLRRRNAAWTDWLVARLDKPGTVLFAVGAGHLAGKESVQNMLAARGFQAPRVD